MSEMATILEGVVARQAAHPVYPRIVVALGERAGEVKVTVGERTVVVPAGEALRMIEGRQRAIALEESDPFRHGYEAPFWREVDWAVAELRCRDGNQRSVLEVLIQGGNRSAKTEYAAKRFVLALALNAGWLVWAFAFDQGGSRSIQQRRVWKYLPAEFKPMSGRARKTERVKLNYNQETGFTENIFSLGNGSASHFKFYSGDVKALEGDEPDMVWSDEEIPVEWVEALNTRLITKAGKLDVIREELVGALAMRARGEMDELPLGLRSRMWRGVHLITFTPISGQTPTVRRFTAGATVVRSVPAELLPIRDAAGGVCGYEHVPRLMRCSDASRLAAYFHTYDNAHGGNYEGMVASMRGKPSSVVKIKVYGLTSAAKDARFPLFSREVHVRPAGSHKKLGEVTWYHVADPCNGRNFFMIWACVSSLGQVLVAREWPQPEDYIEGIGSLGAWATLSTGKKLDGDRGPAQQSLGWGIKRYAQEIERVERELGGGERIQVFERIIDSRAGNTPNLATSETVTLIELLAAEELFFEPSGMVVAAEGAPRKNTINEGIDLLNDALSYDVTKAGRSEDGRTVPAIEAAPGWYFAENCLNCIEAFENWTGMDGADGAWKDPIDVCRYLRIRNPVFAGGEVTMVRGGGCY